MYHEVIARYNDVALVETTFTIQLVPQLMIATGANLDLEHDHCLTTRGVSQWSLLTKKNQCYQRTTWPSWSWPEQ